MTSVAAQGDLECPASLQQRAPTTLVLEERNGRAVRVTPAGFSLVANSKYQLRFMLPDRSCQPGQISLLPDEHIRMLGPVQEYKRANGETEFILSFKTTRMFRPFPIQTRLCLNFKHSQMGDYPYEVPIVVWPSLFNSILWAISVVAAPIWTPYLVEASVHDGHLRPFSQIVGKIENSQELLLLTLTLSLLLYLLTTAYFVFSMSDSA